ncbi:Scr1 family TA system antitoxin-like transcriptional regulator [Amycolatopsis sp. cmx-4-61]|uniref:Scr1 family TA system antitoxin-like transcriptional regulator n=1 Tax=Amycolatopsis sp. cmx-4-61 TaxID=2790937 RepID=UPI00397B9BE2
MSALHYLNQASPHHGLLAGTAPTTPFAHRLRVRKTLRRCRDAARLTREELGARLDWSESKVLRIEVGHVGISSTDAEAFLRACGICDPDIIAQVVASARAGRRRTGPFDGKYHDTMTANTREFYEHEQAADQICYLQFATIPDLLVRPAYAIATLARFQHATDNQQQAHLDTLATRQTLLRPDGPLLTIVIDQGALERAIHAPIPYAAFADQLTHLINISQQSNISVHVLPLRICRQDNPETPVLPLEHPAAACIPSCSFALVSYDDEWSLFMPNIGDTLVRHHDPKDTPVYVEQFAHLQWHFCLNPDDSRALISSFLSRRC